MLRIFEKDVMPLIGGRAKAMIVASSRVAGLKYFNIIKEKLRERGAKYKVLYAFSDFTHPETNEAISEHAVNDLKEGELIENRFEGDDYRIMIVANKFQTGFDQPLLAGMFLDKPVVDRNAVQTVSRLNRYHDGKNEVIVVDFTNDDSAYEALTTLKQLGSQGQIKVVEAAVVTRGDDGHIETKDQVGDDNLVGTASGGIVGLLIGILGGPLGVLLGGATGLMIGSLYDMADADDTDSVLSEVSKTVQAGRNAVLAQVVEQSPEVVDTAMERLSGTVVRRPVYEVENEIAAAQEAQREAKKAARKKLREARHEKRQEEAHAKVEELKAKLHLGDKAPAASS